jgi:Kazal-type serine protease inhibitor domain
VQSRDKCGTGGKAYDICRLHYGDRKVCGTDNVTYQNFFVMACTANKYSVGNLILIIRNQSELLIVIPPVRDQCAERRRVQN